MKISRVKTLSVLFLLLFVMMITAIFGDSVRLYMVNSVNINKLKNNNIELETKENVDISRVAYGVTNTIQSSDISNLATDIVRVEVFDGMTVEELSAKLNRALKNKGVLANKGNLIATQCVKLGIDPYVAVAIMLHETGCTWTCSKLVRNKNNVGGMRGKSGWQSFDTIEDGINGFLSNLSRNYYKKGLTTPEDMANKYAGGSTTWAGKIRNYMVKIELA